LKAEGLNGAIGLADLIKVLSLVPSEQNDDQN
jgi:hypothetical protein